MTRYTLLLLLLYSTASISQNCDQTLSGSVVDLHDGSNLVGAVLTVAGSEQTVVTDSDGKFTIQNLCNGTHSIQVSHYHCLTKGFRVRVSGNTTKIFRLEHHIEELNQVIVQGNAYDNNSKTIFENILTEEALEYFQSASMGDALNSLSGVSSINTGNSIVKPLINGLHSSRVVIIKNGVRMEDQEWGAEHAPNVDINSVSNLTLIKGAGALQYGGNAVGGVIIAEASKVPVIDSLYGKTQLVSASNGRGGSITSQLTKSYSNGWHVKVQGTAKRFGDFETPRYVLSNTGVSEQSASVQVGLNRFNYGVEMYYSLFKNEIGILRASHLGGAQDQVRAIKSKVPLVINDFTYEINKPNQDVTHHLARIKGFKRFEGLGKLSLQYDFQRNNRLEFDVRRGERKNDASLNLQLSTHTILLDLDSQLPNEIKLKSGIMARYQNNYAPNTGIRRLIPNYKKYELGAYVLGNYPLNDQWLLEAGSRFDYTFLDAFKYYRVSFWESRNYDQLYSEIVIKEVTGQVLTNPQLNFYNSSATLGATYSANKEYNLFLNYTFASRVPNPSELFSEGLHHSASRIELGSLDFKSEKAHKISATLHRDNKIFRFSVNPYINLINDMIVIEPIEVRQTIRGNFQVWEYRQTNAHLLGIDIDASYSFAKNFVFDHQFSLVKGYDRSMDESLISMPPANTKNEIVYHNSAFKNLRIALQSEYVFRQNEFPNNNFEVYIPETQSKELVDVSTPPAAYHLLHFNSSIDFDIHHKSKLTLGVAVTNLLDTSYRNYLNRLRYYSDDLGRNFLLTLKINY